MESKTLYFYVAIWSPENIMVSQQYSDIKAIEQSLAQVIKSNIVFHKYHVNEYGTVMRGWPE